MSRQIPQPKARKDRQRGFSLIELLIVVAVILVIAAIAIPNFIRSKMRANEAGAVQNLRTLTTANTIYLTTYGHGFAGSLANLGGNAVIVDSSAAGLIDSVLSSGKKSGYSYTYTVTASDVTGAVVGYAVNAQPLNVGTTGVNYFYTDQTAIIRENSTGTAGNTDSPIQ